MTDSAVKLSSFVLSEATSPDLSAYLVGKGRSFTTSFRAPFFFPDPKESTKIATATVYEDFQSKRINARLSELEKELREIKQMLLTNTVNEEGLPELRKIDIAQAKTEIALYFRENDGKEIGYEELIEGLQIEPSIVVRACNALVDEGKIG